nr:MAG TPA: hypothetical protein [Caudoviricetes sp.]
MLFYHFDCCFTRFVGMYKSNIRNMCILTNLEQKKECVNHVNVSI